MLQQTTAYGCFLSCIFCYVAVCFFSPLVFYYYSSVLSFVYEDNFKIKQKTLLQTEQASRAQITYRNSEGGSTQRRCIHHQLF